MREFSYTTKAGSTERPFEVQLTYSDGTVVDLSTATGVVLELRQAVLGTTASQYTGVITEAASGKVKYEWAAGETDVPGIYWGEWVVTFQSGEEERFPSRGSMVLYFQRPLHALT